MLFNKIFQNLFKNIYILDLNIIIFSLLNYKMFKTKILLDLIF